MYGDGKGEFHPATGSPFAIGQAPYPFALGDVNVDGHLDAVASSTYHTESWEPGHGVSLLLGEGAGTFRYQPLPLRTPNAWYIAIGDVNGDQLPDILSTHWEEPKLSVLVGNEQGDFRELDDSPFVFEGVNKHVWSIRILDVNSDGHVDVIGAADDVVGILLGDGQEGFAQTSPCRTRGNGAWRLAVGDVNGDGKVDIVSCNHGSEDVSVLLGK